MTTVTTQTTAEFAKALAEAGFSVFPVREDKTPYAPDGLKSSTTDPWLAFETFEKYAKARIAIHCGRSGIAVLDVDWKQDEQGNVTVDGFTSLEEQWLDVPESFAYDSISGNGRHILYRAPEGKNLPPAAGYRGMKGVDRRSGESYIVFAGTEVPNKDDLAPAPDWLCDETTKRETHAFQGDVKDWYESLEPGEPSAPVRRAIERINDDMSHSDMVAATYEAIRLGAEGHSGVPVLIEALETAWMNRDPGNHTTPEDKWDWKFQEALAGGIEKAGDAIELRKNLPKFSLSLIPSDVPASLYSDDKPADKAGLRNLIRELVKQNVPEMDALSVLWNSATTRDLARDWGLEFCYQLIQDEHARKETSTPVPVREEPTKQEEKVKSQSILTDKEREHAKSIPTFIDEFLSASEKTNGFVVPAYSVPLAWITLSMAVGTRAVIPKSGAMKLNLWFAVLGHSGTGKSRSLQFGKEVLDCIMGFDSGSDTPYWNLGAGSPEGMELAILQRPGMSSALIEDEAASFYKNLLSKDWMTSLPHKMADWYMGEARASQKISLKDLKGKKVSTSFNYLTVSTPEDTLRVIDEDMFGTGFMARMNWIMGPPPTDSDDRYKATRASLADTGRSQAADDLGAHLIKGLVGRFRDGITAEVWGEKKAVTRLEHAFRDMDRKARNHPKYRTIIQPSVIRLDETAWKCASLLALERGDTTFTLDDALVALYYVEQWYQNLLQVSQEIAGAYLRDTRLIVNYVRENGGSVAASQLKRAFGHLIAVRQSELTDRIDYAISSGMLGIDNIDGKTHYVLKDN